MHFEHSQYDPLPNGQEEHDFDREKFPKWGVLLYVPLEVIQVEDETVNGSTDRN